MLFKYKYLANIDLWSDQMWAEYLPDKKDLLLIQTNDLDELSDRSDVAEDTELVKSVNKCGFAMAWQVNDDTVVVVDVFDHVGPGVFVAAEAVHKENGWTLTVALAHFGIAPNAFAAPSFFVFDLHSGQDTRKPDKINVSAMKS